MEIKPPIPLLAVINFLKGTSISGFRRPHHPKGKSNNLNIYLVKNYGI